MLRPISDKPYDSSGSGKFSAKTTTESTVCWLRLRAALFFGLMTVCRDSRSLYPTTICRQQRTVAPPRPHVIARCACTADDRLPWPLTSRQEIWGPEHGWDAFVQVRHARIPQVRLPSAVSHVGTRNVSTAPYLLPAPPPRQELIEVQRLVRVDVPRRGEDIELVALRREQLPAMCSPQHISAGLYTWSDPDTLPLAAHACGPCGC